MSDNFVIKNVHLVGSFSDKNLNPIVSVVPNIFVPPCSKDKLFEIIQFMFNESKDYFSKHKFSSLIMTFEYINVDKEDKLHKMDFGYNEQGVVAVV